MPAVHRLADNCTGHGCFPTRKNVQASSNVFVNDIGVHRKDDAWATHCCGLSCHPSFLAAGSKTVFVNDLDCARIGDLVACGSRCLDGSPDVFAGG